MVFIEILSYPSQCAVVHVEGVVLKRLLRWECSRQDASVHISEEHHEVGVGQHKALWLAIFYSCSARNLEISSAEHDKCEPYKHAPRHLMNEIFWPNKFFHDAKMSYLSYVRYFRIRQQPAQIMLMMPD